MNGNERLFFDTNAVIALLAGNAQLFALTQAASWIGTSVVVALECLAFPTLDPTSRAAFEAFFTRTAIVNLDYRDRPTMELILQFRASRKLRMPDAIVAASAIRFNCKLVSNDAHFADVPNLTVINF